MQRTLRYYFRTYRKRHGLGQKQMAMLLGTSRETISRLEQGWHEPSLETVLYYHILFDADITDLMPELSQSVYALLVRRIERHPYLFSNTRNLREIKRRLTRMQRKNADNN